MAAPAVCFSPFRHDIFLIFGSQGMLLQLRICHHSSNTVFFFQISWTVRWMTMASLALFPPPSARWPRCGHCKLLLNFNYYTFWYPYISSILPSAFLHVLNFFCPRFISNNSFEGNIPVEIGSLPQLEMVFLNSNQFSGNIPTLQNTVDGLLRNL